MNKILAVLITVIVFISLALPIYLFFTSLINVAEEIPSMWNVTETLTQGMMLCLIAIALLCLLFLIAIVVNGR